MGRKWCQKLAVFGAIIWKKSWLLPVTHALRHIDQERKSSDRYCLCLLVLLLISVTQSLYFLFKMLALGYCPGKMITDQARRTDSGERDTEGLKVLLLVPALQTQPTLPWLSWSGYVCSALRSQVEKGSVLWLQGYCCLHLALTAPGKWNPA